MYIQNLKELKPLIHCITNYVTVNDVANAIIACGASPIMADDINEVSEIVAISNALVINLGTLNERTIESMRVAIKEANRLDKVIVLDPVGVGATKFRRDIAGEFLRDYKFSVIKGNLSEIKTLAGFDTISKGVDVSLTDESDSLQSRVEVARNLAYKTDAIVVITGEIDVISSSTNSYICKNGNSMMSEFSGSGCILAGIIASFVASNLDTPLEATVMAVCCSGVAGDLARQQNILSSVGNMTFKTNLIDEIYKMSDSKMKSLAKFEEIV